LWTKEQRIWCIILLRSRGGRNKSFLF